MTQERSDAEEQGERVEIPDIEVRAISLPIHGTTPLIVHKWSEKAKRQMLDAQMKRATKGR